MTELSKLRLAKLTSITLPQYALICKICLLSLEHAHHFQSFVIETDRKLKLKDSGTQPASQNRSQQNPSQPARKPDPLFPEFENGMVIAQNSGTIKNEPITEDEGAAVFFETSVGVSDEGEDGNDDDLFQNQNFIPLRSKVKKEPDESEDDWSPRKSTGKAKKFQVAKGVKTKNGPVDVRGMTCPFCSRFIQGSQFHMNRHHKSCGKPAAERRYFHCDECSKTFTRSDHLLEHKRGFH